MTSGRLVWITEVEARNLPAWAYSRWDAAPADAVSIVQSMLPMPDAFGNTRRNWAAEILAALGMPDPQPETT